VRKFVSTEVSYTPFEFDHESQGNYSTLAFSGESPLYRSLGFGGRVPVHRIDFEHSPDETGLGDIEFYLKYPIFIRPHLGQVISGGLNVEAPTGDDEMGLGAGHWEVDPFVSMSFPFSKWVLHGSFGALFELGGGEEEHHDEANVASEGGEHHDIIDPHEEEELIYHSGVAYVLAPLAFNLVVKGRTDLSNEDSSTEIRLAPEINFISGQFTPKLNADVPLTDKESFTYRVSFATTWRF
jgi:hypothetical protein